jgi:hypothetical protein
MECEAGNPAQRDWTERSFAAKKNYLISEWTLYSKASTQTNEAMQYLDARCWEDQKAFLVSSSIQRPASSSYIYLAPE